MATTEIVTIKPRAIKGATVAVSFITISTVVIIGRKS
jgi:hypothetical protein